MILKGLKKGSNDLRKFTFDDNEYIQKDGHFYYKVNYGKNLLEGEYAEDEIGYVDVTQVITLGGKKPKPIPELEKQDTAPMQYMPPTQETKPEPKKRGRPAKAKPDETVFPVSQDGIQKFEYYVTDLAYTNSENLQGLLNKLGDEGWELCGFEGNRNMFSSTHIVAVFKRKRG